MLATAIKNFILLSLVVAIGYFIIDNHLKEVTNEIRREEREKFAKKIIEQKTVLDDLKKKQLIATSVEEENVDYDVVNVDTEIEEATSCSKTSDKQMKIIIDDDMKEIYNYVYDDLAAEKDLSRMYQQTAASDVQIDLNVACSSTEQDKIKDMCIDPIKEHHLAVNYDHIESKPISNMSMYDLVDQQIKEIAV